MGVYTIEELRQRKCGSCEGGVPPMTPEEVAEQAKVLPEWQVTDDSKRLRREWKAKNFPAAITFFDKVGELAESEGHHPDLHLTGYRNVVIDLTTHAIGGLSENDFILAAKIDEIPLAQKT